MSADETAQFNADVVEYMDTHAGMWTIRTRVAHQEHKPGRPPLARGIPFVVVSHPTQEGTWLIKHLWDARRDKVW